MDRIKNILNIFRKKSLLDFKFSKGDKVIIISREIDGLKGREGIVKKCKPKNDINIYYIDDIVYPNKYYLIHHEPVWFEESELDFVNKDDERNYKLKKLLND